MAREVVVYPVAHVFDAEEQHVDEGRVDSVRPHPEGGSTHITPGAEVVWHRESGWMQLGIMLPREMILGAAKMIEDLEKPDAEIGDDSPTFSMFVDLNRGDANRMIRTLRRARNAAFGADE